MLAYLHLTLNEVDTVGKQVKNNMQTDMQIKTITLKPQLRPNPMLGLVTIHNKTKVKTVVMQEDPGIDLKEYLAKRFSMAKAE